MAGTTETLFKLSHTGPEVAEPSGRNQGVAEEVSANAYGEVVWIKETSEEGQLSFELPAQSVMLLTIPICSNAASTLVATGMQPLRPGQIVRKTLVKPK